MPSASMRPDFDDARAAGSVMPLSSFAVSNRNRIWTPRALAARSAAAMPASE